MDDKIKNLINNVNYIIIGTEDGWLNVNDKHLIRLCYYIKTLSKHSYDELFKFEKKGYAIKLK